MKQKLLLALLALFTLGGGNLFAQTDVANTYITNADFSSTDGWTQSVSSSFKDIGNGLIGTYGVRTAEGQAVSTVDETHLATEYCFGFEARWESNFASYNQETKELPIGVYTLTFDVENTNPQTTNATYDNLFYVQVGEEKITDNSTEWMKGKSSWTTHTIQFDITEAAKATISLGYGTGSNNIGSKNTPTLHVSHLKLTFKSALDVAKEALQAEIDRAKLCDAKEGLADAIAAAEEALANATTAEELSAALAALQTADKDALLRYDNGLADASAQNGMATTFVVNGTFDSNTNGWTCTGGFQNKGTATNQQGDFTGKFWENWNRDAMVNKMYQTINNIPNGTYKLKIAAFVNTLADPNESQFVFANNDKTYLTTGAPTFYEVWTVVTDNKVEIGLEQTTATANWMGIDNVSLTYYGAGDVIEEAQVGAHKINWDEALAAAKAAVANSDYANVTGEELAALNTEIAKAEPTTADGYDAATEALRAATRAFTEAKASYDAFVKAKAETTVPELAYAAEAKKTALTEAIAAEAATNATDAAAKANAIVSGLRAYYESHALAEGVEGAKDYTDAIKDANADTNTGWTNGIGTNQGQGYTDAAGTVAAKYLDGGWSSNAGVNIDMTREVSVPAGKYLLSVTARGAADLTEYTLSIAGQTVDLPHIGGSNGVFGNGWNDANLEFESKGEPLTLELVAKSTASQQWISFNRFRLVQLEAIEVPMADADDYAALATAITAAEGNVLGFDADEYAPYNNVAALQALAAAKAINPEAEDGNTKELVNNVTTALTAATWTANTEEVNAVHNGMFATVQEGANYPEGWNRTNAWGQMQSNIAGDYATAYYNQPGSLKYGENGVYTMPLKENTAYVLNFAYRSHENNSNNGVTVSVLNGEDGLSNKVFEGNGSTTEWKSATVYFTTGAAGNYVLTLANNGNTWMTNVSIFKAKAVDITIKAGRQYTAFSSSVALDFTGSELTAQIVTDENGTAQTVTKVPANTGVIVGLAAATAEAKTISVPVCAGETDAVTGNMLVAVLEATTVQQQSAEGNINYVFGKSGGKEQFFKVRAAGMTVPANNAYLAIPEAQAKGIDEIGLNGDATGISTIENADMQNGEVYNLQGQKVNRAQKGVYIVNGKKVILK